MTNANFVPTMSTDEIYRGQNTTQCLTDDLDSIESSISNIGSSFAPVNHTHSGYASTNHTHSYLPLSGGTVTGTITANNDINMSVESAICGKAANGTTKNVFVPLSAAGNTAIGYDNYQNSDGNTNIYGDDVRIWSRDAGIAGRSYGVNKVLWSGAQYMKEDTVVTLSENVSAQPHGIVLVFSAYTVGTGESNTHWHNFFVPKYDMGIDSGGGYSYILERGGKFYKKYLYINNGEIRGSSDNNNPSYTLHGQTVDNRNFVLRYVIGV